MSRWKEERNVSFPLQTVSRSGTGVRSVQLQEGLREQEGFGGLWRRVPKHLESPVDFEMEKYLGF